MKGQLLASFGAVANGLEIIDRMPRSNLAPLFEEAMSKVRGRSFEATLTTARWLLSKLVDEIMQEMEEQESEGQGNSGGSQEQRRSQALQTMTDAEQDLPPEYLNAINDFETSSYASKDSKHKSLKTVKDSFDTPVSDEKEMDRKLANTEHQMEARVKEVNQALAKPMTRDNWISDGARAKVVFRDVSTSDVTSPAPHMTEADQTAINRLRSQFFRVMGRKRSERTFYGSEVDVNAYIQYRATGQPEPIFKVDSTNRGFRALILVDRPGSMKGPPSMQAQRYCRVIKRALNFPFVKTEVWGFQSLRPQQVDLTRFENGVEVFKTKKSGAGGSTPLHVAMRVARRHLSEGNEQKHIFVLTDGLPTIFNKRDKIMSGKWIEKLVKDEVDKARQSGIGVTCAMIESTDLNLKANMRRMFGHSRHWRIVDEKTFGTDLLKLVVSNFVNYLKA